MGIEGKGTGYGEKVDSILDSVGHNMNREDFLRLAWACVDQAGTRETIRATDLALRAIEDMFDAEPETRRTGEP